MEKLKEQKLEDKIQNDIMTNTNPYPVISKEECKACKRCILACPQNAILQSHELNNAGYQFAYYKGEGCVGCRDCYYTCPEPLAIEIHSYKRIKNNDISKMIQYKTGDKK